MNLKHHTSPEKLEFYSFAWSLARLVIAAIALFIGGTPVLRAVLPIAALSGIVSLILTVTWIISGLASGYLIYRWFTGHKTIFGGKKLPDTVAFFVLAISGLNLGITGLTSNNIGMSISSSYTVFIITGILYLVTAVYLVKRWNESGKKLFSGPNP